MGDIKYYIGYTQNTEDRFNASSGGIGTAITRFLLSLNEFGTAVTFRFNVEMKMYEPLFIYRAEDLNVCGSIYQDINIASFVKDNIELIKGGVIISCPPCQVSAVRNVLNYHNIRSFIISFCCSGQTTIEGTWKYYEFLGINKDDILGMQYRGKGWPSGIQIKLKDGTNLIRGNWTEPWITIHQSGFYRPMRCFYCMYDSSYQSDVSLADPWIENYIKNDKVGNTLFFTNTGYGKEIVSKMKELGLINIREADYNLYYIAQQPNVEKENRKKNHTNEIKRDIKLIENKYIRKFFTKSFSRMKLFIKFKCFITTFFKRNVFRQLTMQVFDKLSFRLRYWLTAQKVGSHDGYFNIGCGVKFNNPQCIHIGKNVGIGEKVFFLPVTNNNGHTYTPIILIGEGTWIGKGCSIAAINQVKIGKHVLFAGQVHITDHSHGYEDITRPIAPQPLITKGPIVIEDDCWIGFSSEILSGVHIGKHSIIAARSVVTKDVPSYSIVAGNPARIVKQYNFETKKWEKR